MYLLHLCAQNLLGPQHMCDEGMRKTMIINLFLISDSSLSFILSGFKIPLL